MISRREDSANRAQKQVYLGFVRALPLFASFRRKGGRTFRTGAGVGKRIVFWPGLPEMRRSEILTAIDETLHKSDRLFHS